MIDIHTHILPGLDDGARDLEESIEMARLAVKDGTKFLLATPHVLPGIYENNKEDIIQAVQNLNQSLQEEQIPITIISGSEIQLEPDLPYCLDRGELLALNNDDKYLLVDLPDGFVPVYASEVLFQLQLRGITPIIAHPERHTGFASDLSLVAELVSRGILVQLTCGSITGFFGGNVRKNAFSFLREGLVHFLASDTHSCQGRIPGLTPAFRILERSFGIAYAYKLVCENPWKMLRGEPIGEGEVNFYKGWWSKRFSRLLKSRL